MPDRLLGKLQEITELPFAQTTAAVFRKILAVFILAFGLFSPQLGHAQADDPVQTEKVQQFLKLIEDPQVRSWLLSAKPTTDPVA